MSCIYKKFSKERLCANDLTHELTLFERAIAGDHPDDVGQANSAWAELFVLWAAHKPVSPFRPVESVVVGRKVTDVFYVRTDDLDAVIDITRHTIRHESDNYRIDQVMKLSGGHIVALYCELTGDVQEGLA
jgi:hypothetical protein